MKIKHEQKLKHGKGLVVGYERQLASFDDSEKLWLLLKDDKIIARSIDSEVVKEAFNQEINNQ